MSLDELCELLDVSLAEALRRTEVRLDKRDLPKLPEALTLLTQVQVLHLWRNRLTTLPTTLFASLPHLRELWLGSADGGNSLSALPESIASLTGLSLLVAPQNCLSALPDALGTLTLLRELYLWGNCLSALPESLGNLGLLTKLSAPQNKISLLPDSFGRLTMLRELWLGNSNGGNCLSSLPETIGNLRNLTQLVVPQNRLTSLPESISLLTQLRELYLWGNQLSSIPSEVCFLTLLTKICLYQNKISHLPEAIGRLVLLKELWLGSDNGGNFITALPASIGLLQNLTYFAPSNNRITQLPDTIGRLTQLKELYLWGNQLSSLPQTIGNLVSLTKLSLPQNKLPSLPSTISKLTGLQELWIGNSNGGNLITSLPETIGNLTHLTYFAPSNNRLSRLPESIGRLTRIREMYLWGNQLTTLPYSVGRLVLLTRLSVSQNKLQSVPDSVGSLTNLQELDFKSNLLSTLPQTIGLLSKLQRLNLEGNPVVRLPFSVKFLPCYNLSRDIQAIPLEQASHEVILELARLRLWKPMISAAAKAEGLPTASQFKALPLDVSIKAISELSGHFSIRQEALSETISNTQSMIQDQSALLQELEERVAEEKKKLAEMSHALVDLEQEQKLFRGKPEQARELYATFANKWEQLKEKLRKNMVKTMTTEEVVSLLHLLDIPVDEALLIQHEITGSVFLALTESDLSKDLHISNLYHRLLILQAISMMHNGAGEVLIKYGVSSLLSEVDAWDVDEVVAWLKSIEMEAYADAFREEKIDGRVLVALNDIHLQESLKVPTLGHRKAIMMAIQDLKSNCDPIDLGGTTPDIKHATPSSYLCPIAQELMRDPVFAADGYTYERQSIEKWFRMGKKTSPMTNQPLQNLDLTPNRTLKSDISEWLLQQK
eukprot:TRINITY_DN10455_c0_g1_i1.p1 TRINITY_DN10455_c0_g1~~TRINITY_DN10455_c0_g1_i1.p1  ORF type:complete len:889 (+),score=195.27 TRINITY_DN10455_c0_g1_i1:131-2797(+)